MTVDDDGQVQTYCIYSAPNRDLLHEHATVLGSHVIDQIQEIAGDVSPADFPSAA